MAKGRAELRSFAITMQSDYDPSWHHNIIANKLEAVESGKIKRLMLCVPPRHGKSQLASVMFPAWYLGRNPTKEIISCSYNDEFAEEFGRKSRNLVADEKFRLMFGVGLSSDSKRINRWSTDKGGGYVASGVGGTITGRGAEILLIDDPIKNKEEAESASMRQKAWDWYVSTAYTRLHPGGAVVLVGTRWHDDDLLGRVLEHEGDQWDVVNFPAIAIKNEKYRKKGEALWPQRYPLEELKKIQITVGPLNWASLYQQNPILSETQDFKKEWFKKSESKPERMQIMTTVDPAVSQSKRADDSVVLTAGMDPQGEIHILEISNRKMNPTELINEIFRHKTTWNPQKVGIETVAFQKSLVHFMKSEMRKRQTYINIYEIKSRSSKEERIRGLIPYYQNGVIWHNQNCGELEDQLLRFPSGRKDDIADCLSFQLELLKKPQGTKSMAPTIQYHPLTGAVIGITNLHQTRKML